MNIYSGLLFLHGHIADTDLAQRLGDGDVDGTAPSRQGGNRGDGVGGVASSTHGVDLRGDGFGGVAPSACGVDSRR
ncbi:hypothetical protein [Stenotrophomonas rhizophila]|uniref:hypothetical protein n=1 Tax=Stenotrophomonas rhizophila TaxID=216778 RepID=UPI001E39EBB1|nr:hypothetical protein [Stenotrophomonas rhizophila]MCC7633848.1 hypothetical protein [Stenotrophomonas rhizophila]MCC7665382.1 hypothetical protein [Stenotrophomonas rhizophila]